MLQYCVFKSMIMKNTEIKQLIEKYSSGISTDEEVELFDLVTNKPDDLNEDLWADNIIKSSKVIQKYFDNKKAITLLTTAYEEYKTNYPNAFRNKVNILRTICYIQLEEHKLKDAHDTMNRYLYNALDQVKFVDNTPKMNYYSFRGISDYAINEITNDKISLAHPRMFNDPLDTILVWWLENEIKQGEKSEQEMNFRLLMKKASEHIKLRCLVGSKYLEDGKWQTRKVEDLSVLMWAHYANSHTGMCIEYNFDRKFFKTSTLDNEEELIMIIPIEYVSKIDINTDVLSFKKALFTKSDFWKYENEMRLCAYNVRESNEFPEIDCKGAIKAVYLGAKCSDVNRRKVEKAIGDKDIPLFKMELDEKLLTRLKKVQIG